MRKSRFLPLALFSLKEMTDGNLYSQYENNNEVLSEQGVRKTLYQRVRLGLKDSTRSHSLRSGWLDCRCVS